MRFVVDNQLSPGLLKFLRDAGHDSVHVTMVGMDAAKDRTLWEWAIREDRIFVSTQTGRPAGRVPLWLNSAPLPQSRSSRMAPSAWSQKARVPLGCTSGTRLEHCAV